MNYIKFGFFRAQVNEMWSKGERVTCGVITDDTRVRKYHHIVRIKFIIHVLLENSLIFCCLGKIG